MREFKFRAWNSDSKEMEYMEPYHGLYNISFIEYMQYTGLKDKNGKKIYEGDILEYETGYREKVKYEKGCFLTIGLTSCDYLYSSLKLEPIVVGNIYENKELLEEN